MTQARPKIAVYAICKDEAQFVDRWMDSMHEADEIVVLDTGSKDDTVDKLRSRGVHVEVGVFKPWRFDLPRNTSMHLVSADVDICVCTDLDEILTPGWRAALEKCWVENGGKIGGVGKNLRVKYLYTWNFNPDGTPGTTFWYEKIHTRDGYRWVKPVHEITNSYLNGESEQPIYCHGFQLHHFPDNTKSRSSYLPLLKMSVEEEPEDDRNSHYYGRELMYYGQFDKAIDELVRHLSLPRAKWLAERAASMRYISRCFVGKGNRINALEWAFKACAEDATAREPWVHLAKVLEIQCDWAGMLFAINRALDIKERPSHYINEPESWSAVPYELGAKANFNLDRISEAEMLVHQGLEIDSTSTKLKEILSQIDVVQDISWKA